MPKPTPAPTPTLGDSVLRIVLFGMPAAGKSSLLGALSEAAQTQESLLNGHLTDLGGGLAELGHRLYDQKPQPTVEEVVPYAVAYESTAERTEALLVDCDGRVANELITRRRALSPERENLAQAVLDADTLLLVIDASTSPSQLDNNFAEFGRFLRSFEQSRGRRSDVGGLPVFLVLSKCDLLAHPADTIDAWMERIEERKRQVDARFQIFLARQKVGSTLPFGRIDLHVWATAVKRPALAGMPAMPREPYGVAELFRQAFALARAFQERRQRSGRRLAWTVAGGTGMVAALLALVTALFIYRPQEDPAIQELATKVESYRAREAQTPSSRLREPLQRKISELTELKTDRRFSSLPPEKQDYVRTHLQELQDYRAYDAMLRALPRIEGIRSERELEEMEKSLSRLALPAERQPDWNQTEAALFRDQMLTDVKAVRKAVAQMEDWFNSLSRRGQELWTFSRSKPGAPLSWLDWQKEVQTLLADADASGHQPSERLAQSSVTYGTVLQVDGVSVARGNWETVRRKLERTRDLSNALGLAGTSPGRAQLDIPAGFQAEQAAARLQELEKLYPGFQQDFQLSDLPEAIVPEIRQTARIRYDHVLKAGQEVVLRHWKEVNPGGPETPESWRRLQPWLAAPEDVKAWRLLATVLARLQDPAAGDPVSALDTFLRRERFDLQVRRLTLEIPDASKVRPDGRFLIHHFSDGEKRTPLAFEATGVEHHDARRQATRYEFQLAGDGSADYKPGDTLWADLPVQKAGESGWLLTWARNRSQVYQFERLLRPPRLHLKGKENTQGEVQEGISLQIAPEGGVPKMPDLMPVVPLARQSAATP